MFDREALKAGSIAAELDHRTSRGAPRQRPDLDGLRLVDPGGSDVWLVYFGLRHLIACGIVFDSLFGTGGDLVVREDLTGIAEGDVLNKGSCLVREHGGLTIFLLTGEGRSLRLHQIATYETFLDFGFDLGKVIDIPRLVFDGIQHGRRLSSAADRSKRQGWSGPDEDALAALRTLLAPPRQTLNLKSGDRLIVCTHGLPPGGAERQWVYLAQGLARQGFDVVFVVYDGVQGENGHYLPLLQRLPVRLIDRDSPSAPEPLHEEAETYLRSMHAPEREKLRWLTATFAAERPKAVFAQLDLTNILCGIAANLAGVPRVVLSFRNCNPTHFHYMDSDWFQPMYRELAASQRVTLSGNSRQGNNDYAEWLGVAPEQISLVHNAIDHDIFPVPEEGAARDLRGELGLSAEAPVLLGVFRLSAEKDPLVFLHVCARVLAAKPDLQVLIAGVGPLRQQMERFIQQFGLGARVRLLGRRSDINVLMSIASVLLLTSLREGMPNVLLEAQLSALPIVSTNVGGVSDTVADSQSAFLHDPGDVEGLARSCLAILDDPAVATRLSEGGRERARAFSCEALAVRHLALLK